ncbi:MAG: hypothetical protein EBX41_09655 [Chitinophagia bacterium]|nr:hypothetical protein [Chitinophagia bacterium]
MAKLNQEQLLGIFNTLKAAMLLHEKGSIKARFNIEGKYDLWSEIPGLTIAGRLRNEVAFCAIIVQSTYVGFYYMPIYGSPDNIGGQLAPSSGSAKSTPNRL